jgi:HK97 family phage major capsid protein
MIPNALTACRGFVMRKVAGRFDACRQLVSSSGLRVTHPSLLATVGVFVLMLMPVLIALAAIAAALHAPHDSLMRFAEVVPVAAGANLRELRSKRSKAIADARSIVDTAEREKRAMTGEEETRYKAFMAESQGLKSTITASEELAEEERSLAERSPSPITPTPKKDERKGPRGTEEYRNAFNRWIHVGERGLKPEEQRALSVGSDAGGGFTVVHEEFANELIRAVDNTVILRKLATVRPIPSATSLGVPTLETDPDDADWTSELAIGNEDSSMAFGKRKMVPHPLAKLIKVSKDFLRLNSGGDALVRDRLAYKNGIAQEKSFMTGTGVQQSLGIFTASADGITTARDVSTGNTTTAPTFDGLLGAKYALKEQYRKSPSVRWILHPDVLLVIAKIKNGNGDYIWKESVREGEPDRILGIPLLESQYAPNTLTTGLYVAALGDWKHYWIADALDFSIQRLDELYAATNQVGFICRSATDGQFTLAEAAVRVKLA